MQHARRALTIPSSSARTRTRVGAHAQTRSQHATMLARRALCRLLSASAGCSSSRGVATSCARLARDAPSTPGGSAGSEGAAPGRVAGSDADVKFGSADSSPSSGELYGREDRDPTPSPNPGVTQGTAAQMSFPRDEPSRGGSEAAGAAGDSLEHGTHVAKQEGLKDPRAYPIQNDPSVPDGAGPELTPEKAQELQQDESAGPKAAGQGVVEGLAKQDPGRYGSGRSSPA